MSDPSDPTPERPGMEPAAHSGTPRDSAAEEPDSSPDTSPDTRPDSSGGGQVSEVARLDPADTDTPIQPSDSTAGYPDSESGDPDVRGSGPDAAPPENRRDNDFKKDGKKLGESVDDL